MLVKRYTIQDWTKQNTSHSLPALCLSMLDRLWSCKNCFREKTKNTFSHNIQAATVTTTTIQDHHRYVLLGIQKTPQYYTRQYFFSNTLFTPVVGRSISQHELFQKVCYNLIKSARKILILICINKKWWYQLPAKNVAHQRPDRKSCVPCFVCSSLI